ncbi:MAG: TasA family protein [Alphaproteobacteria bacterium]|nr:TasA family protein [Alphaproteobacteria bacterium]
MKFNKKLVAGIMAIALAATAATGFTLAYFTDYTQTDSNTVTMGHVDISLEETSTASPGVLAGDPVYDNDDFIGFDYDNVMPGDVYSKEPVITVEADSQDCYVRALVTLKTTDSDADGVITAADLLGYLNIDENDWFIGTLTGPAADGTYSVYVYYDSVLSAGDTVTLFETVSFPWELNNNNTDDEYLVSVKAEAIQAANVTPTTNAGGMITGWPAADILQYQ